MGGNVSMLKSSSPLCCKFLHLFPMFVFGIVNSLLGGREISWVVCLWVHHKVITSLCDDLL